MMKIVVVVTLIALAAGFVQGCKTDKECPKCTYPKTAHCHDDSKCYCDIPIECKGVNDIQGCKALTCPCVNGTKGCVKGKKPSVCRKDGPNKDAHWHCVCL